MASIENAVNNLLDYYSYAVKSSKNNIDVIGLQTQIKNCLALLRYVSISQGLVDKICGFILAQEFREILINDKVLFLDRQLVHRKMYSKTTSKIVENTLISYLDKHIAALKRARGLSCSQQARVSIIAILSITFLHQRRNTIREDCL